MSPSNPKGSNGTLTFVRTSALGRSRTRNPSTGSKEPCSIFQTPASSRKPAMRTVPYPHNDPPLSCARRAGQDAQGSMNTLNARGSSTAAVGYLPGKRQRSKPRFKIEDRLVHRFGCSRWIEILAYVSNLSRLGDQKHHVLLTINAPRGLDQRFRLDLHDRR
jgi:hypothetical protein